MQRFPLPAEAAYSYAQGFTNLHRGVDIMADAGTPVVAVSSGRAWASVEPKGGNVVYIDAASDGLVYFFGHLSEVSARLAGTSQAAPALVTVGEQIGAVGNSGNAAGRPPHLHFQMRQPTWLGRQVLDPFPTLLAADPRHAGTPLDIYDGYKAPLRQALLVAVLFWAVSKRGN